MNKVASKKIVTRYSQKKSNRGQKRKYEKDNSVSHKTKRMKKTRYSKQKSARYLNEYTEYEASKMDLRKVHAHLTKISSDNSVIYVKTYPNHEIPIIDLTKSSHSILYSAINSKTIPSSTSLKLIYKSNNFNRPNKNITKSLLTIPLKKKLEAAPGVKSTSNLIKFSKEKIALLDIPPEYFDEDTDGSEYAFHDLSKAELNDDEKNMIENILVKDDGYDPAYSLETKQPIENMCKMYGVGPDDNFD